MYKEKTECIYCYEVYRVEDHETCPNCAVNPQTKGITIIELKDTEPTCEYCGELSTDCESLEECNYNKEDIGADDDALYENYKEQQAADHFDSKQ